MSKSIQRLALVLLVVGIWLGMVDPALSQGLDLANRPIAQISIEGLKLVPEKLVANQIRLNRGDAYDPTVVQQDIVRITHLGRFSSVTARVQPQTGGGVILTYVVTEHPLLSDVQVVGNKAITDQELLQIAVLRAGDPIDPFLIERASKQMKAAYEKEGYFQAEVSADPEVLKESNILIFRVREGPFARIREIRFEGNTVYDADQLMSKIKSREYIWIFRKGEVNREQLENDAARVRDFYRDSGYLDAQVGRRIDLSPDQKDAVVVFIVSEGRQFTVNQIRVQGNQLYGQDQILQAMTIKIGDVYTADRLKKTQENLTDLYGKLGFIESQITIERLFHEQEPKVDLLIKIKEGQAYEVGKLIISGNLGTQDKVVLRHVRGLNPGRPYDRAGIAMTEQRLKESPLFSESKVTILGDEDQRVRDALVEVKEGQTGSVSFGAGVSSDAGVIGAIDLAQRNFDITDLPESWGEFFTGRAFRGAGQFFSLSLQPGNEFSRYAVSFREPYFLESDYYFDTSAFFYTRDRDRYNEERLGGSAGIGHRFGDVWAAAVNIRVESINIGSIDPESPIDVFAVQGESMITVLGFSLTRNTTDSRIFPTKGHVLESGIGRAGTLGGDYDFTYVNVDFKKFWTVDEDFFGVKTIVTWKAQAAYIFDTAPIFERLYAGGHRSFRGFTYRGVGPRGIRNDTGVLGADPIGGNWLFLTGLEYNFPIYQDIVRSVLFIDSGTVQKDIGFDQYRVSIGAGIRLKIPFLGQAPFALDFAIPLTKQDGDDTRVFSFDLAVPF